MTTKSKAGIANPQSAPLIACLFVFPDSVQLADADSGTFHIDAYDGGIIANHWYWGNLAFDLDGLAVENRKKTPVFDSHDYGVRLGFSTRHQVRPIVSFDGQFLDNAQAKDLRADMQKGFPMQASLGLIPKIVEQVSEGATVEVNGKTLKGPGAVFRKALIREVSMCPFGSAPNTSSTVMADDHQKIEFEFLEKESTMDGKEVKPALTVETFKADNPQLYEQILKAGQSAGIEIEKDRFAVLKKACGDDPGLLVECFEAGLTVADALGKANAKLVAQLKEANTQLAAAGQSRSVIDQARQEFKNQPPADPKAAQFDEAKATDQELEAHFAAMPELRDRFSSAKAYVAHVRHPPKT